MSNLDANAHWEWAQRQRARFGDAGCTCNVCDLMPELFELRAQVARLEKMLEEKQ